MTARDQQAASFYLDRLSEVTERMRQQVIDAGSTARIHEEDIMEAARLVRVLVADA